MAVAPATADQIATVLAMNGTANGPQGAIEVGDRIEEGLTIRTNGNTQVELRFDDGTLMAVGPNSELVISAVLMNSNSQASRFAVNATAGSFRFLSGDSQQDAYEITTPASTIGIRGTEFDIFVRPQVTAVLLYRGALEMCLSGGGDCWAFRGSCYLAEANLSRNTVRGLRANEALSYLSNFIYARSQRALLSQLHTNITSCNKYLPDEDDPVVVEEEEGGEGLPEEEEMEEGEALEEVGTQEEAASAEVTCENDGEGLLCFDPSTGNYFYDGFNSL